MRPLSSLPSRMPSCGIQLANERAGCNECCTHRVAGSGPTRCARAAADPAPATGDHDDILDHATLQKELTTALCLDESITGLARARQALDIGACRIVNVKVGRVGGYSQALAIHDLCFSRGVPLWCGGMLESGIGRAHNVALASLPGFTLPGDISASRRYFARDIIAPEVEVAADGTVAVPQAPGLGFEVDVPFLESHGEAVERLARPRP
jgi:o-succinylbenzoate synthase